MWDQLRAELALSWRTYIVIVRSIMERQGITGVVSEVLLRHAILVPLDDAPQLITHQIRGLRPGDEIMFDEVTRGARRKT